MVKTRTKATEKKNIVGRNLRSSPFIIELSQELTRFQHPFGRTLTIRFILSDQVGKNILHPLRHLVIFLYRVTDVFSTNFLSRLLNQVGLLYNFTYFIAQLFGAFA